MATYNGEKYIHKQLASILSQLKPDDEVVISDDGSTDATLSIIKQFADSRIRILVNNLEKSATKNFENSLKHATGDIIFLSDQDDIWLPNKVKIMTPYLEDFDLIVSNCDFIDENDNRLGGDFFTYFNSGPGLIKNFIKNTYLGNCMAFRRILLDKALPFPEEMHRATKYLVYQDVWLGLLANAMYKVKFIPQKLSGFRRHANNASPTEMGVKSPQSYGRIMRGRVLLAIALIKRFLR